MKHVITINGVISYELQPETDDDRHVVEIMKNKGKVTMRQSSKGGLIFDLERPDAIVSVPEGPVDLSNESRSKGKP